MQNLKYANMMVQCYQLKHKAMPFLNGGHRMKKGKQLTFGKKINIFNYKHDYIKQHCCKITNILGLFSHLHRSKILQVMTILSVSVDSKY